MKSLIEKKIRSRLLETGLTVTELAKKIGVSRVALYHLFKGNYSREMLNRISEVLSIPPHILLSPDNPEINDSTSEGLFQAYREANPPVQMAVRSLLGMGTVEKKTTRRPIIFVIDDLEDNVALLKRCLRKDYDVLEFTDPLKALEAVRKQEVDAIISDQRMPQMTGTEFFTKVDEMQKPILKLIISAYTDNTALVQAINDAKVNGFFIKPFNPADLKSRLQRILN